MLILFVVITYVLSTSLNLALCINHCSNKKKKPDKMDMTMVFVPVVNLIVSISIILFALMQAGEKRKG